MYSESRRTSEPHGSLVTPYLYCMFSIVFPSQSIPLVALIGHPVLLVLSLSYSDRSPPVADRFLSLSSLSFSLLRRSLIGDCHCLSIFCRHAFFHLPLSLLTSRSLFPLAIINIACGSGKSLCCNPLGRTDSLSLLSRPVVTVYSSCTPHTADRHLMPSAPVRRRTLPSAAWGHHSK